MCVLAFSFVRIRRGCVAEIQGFRRGRHISTRASGRRHRRCSWSRLHQYIHDARRRCGFDNQRIASVNNWTGRAYDPTRAALIDDHYSTHTIAARSMSTSPYRCTYYSAIKRRHDLTESHHIFEVVKLLHRSAQSKANEKCHKLITK